MLTCREVTAKASALLDSELGFRERLPIWLHLWICVHCRRFRRQLRMLVAGMGITSRTGPKEMPPELVERVMTALERARSQPSRTQ